MKLTYQQLVDIFELTNLKEPFEITIPRWADKLSLFTGDLGLHFEFSSEEFDDES